jgi:hypothetical protein
MDSQTLNKLFHLYNLTDFRFSPTFSTGQAACAAPGDYGFDFDGSELENEPPSAKFNGQSNQLIQPVEASEFDMRYRWFIS